MSKKIKKMVVGLGIGLSFACMASTAPTAPQQVQPVATSGEASDFMSGKRAVAKMGYENVPILFFTGSNAHSDKQTVLLNYLPFSTVLSEKGRLNSVFIFEKNLAKLEERAAAFDYAYVPALVAASLSKKGFTPVLRHSDDGKEGLGVFVAKSESSLKELKELGNRKMAWSESSHLAAQAKHAMVKVGINAGGVVANDVGYSSPETLKSMLDGKSVEVVVVSAATASKWMGDGKDAYKILGKTVQLPGFTLMARSTKVGTQLSRSLFDAWFYSVGDSGRERAVSDGIRNGSGLTGKFVGAKPEDFKAVDEVVSVAASWKKQ